MRTWLVGVSLAVHVAILFALFVAGMWRIERLDPAKHRIDLAVSMPPPPAPSGSMALHATPFTPKRHAVHEVVQPTHVETVQPVAAIADMTGTGSGIGSGTGIGSGDSDATGTCTENCGPGSGAPPQAVAVVVHTPALVAPAVLRGLRISGETQVQAPEAVRNQLVRDGKRELRAMFKLCIDAGGAVASVAALHSSGFPAYDDRLVTAMRAWRYRPYQVDSVAIPACGVVTFIYGIE